MSSANTHAIRLETERLILREHHPEDLAPLHAMLSDPATTWYLPDMRKADIDETAAYLHAVMRDDETPLRLRINLIVQEKASGEVVGSVGLHVIDGGDDGVHYGLGYFIRRDLWNRGYTTEAVRAALSFIFSADACRVTASCLAENLSSRRVLEKCGFSQEGLLKKHTWHEGEWKDCVVYGILRVEFGVWSVECGVLECQLTLFEAKHASHKLPLHTPLSTLHTIKGNGNGRTLEEFNRPGGPGAGGDAGAVPGEHIEKDGRDEGAAQERAHPQRRPI